MTTTTTEPMTYDQAVAARDACRTRLDQENHRYTIAARDLSATLDYHRVWFRIGARRPGDVTGLTDAERLACVRYLLAVQRDPKVLG